MRKDRTFKFLYVISILINVAYFALRIVYIVTGRVKVTAPANASQSQLDAAATQRSAAVVYSIIVLVAELGGFVLVHVGQQMFTRQQTQFATMTPDNVSKMAQVRPRDQRTQAHKRLCRRPVACTLRTTMRLAQCGCRTFAGRALLPRRSHMLVGKY